MLLDLPETETRAFLAAIAEEPDDDARRLVFADWLDERGHRMGPLTRRQVAGERVGDEQTEQWLKEGAVGAVYTTCWAKGRLDVHFYADALWRRAELLRVGWVQGLTCGGWWGDDAKRAELWAVNDLTVSGVHTDYDLSPLTPAVNLNTLELVGHGVTDDTLSLITNLAKLRALRLNHTRVTDDGLARLPELPRLRVIELRGTAVTPAGLERLRRERRNLLVEVGRSVAGREG